MENYSEVLPRYQYFNFEIIIRDLLFWSLLPIPIFQFQNIGAPTRLLGTQILENAQTSPERRTWGTTLSTLNPPYTILLQLPGSPEVAGNYLSRAAAPPRAP